MFTHHRITTIVLTRGNYKASRENFERCQLFSFSKVKWVPSSALVMKGTINIMNGLPDCLAGGTQERNNLNWTASNHLLPSSLPPSLHNLHTWSYSCRWQKCATNSWSTYFRRFLPIWSNLNVLNSFFSDTHENMDNFLFRLPTFLTVGHRVSWENNMFDRSRITTTVRRPVY